MREGRGQLLMADARDQRGRHAAVAAGHEEQSLGAHAALLLRALGGREEADRNPSLRRALASGMVEGDPVSSRKARA